MIGDALNRELISDLRLDYPPETEEQLLSVLKRMERRAVISTRIMLLWLIVTGTAACILIHAGFPGIAIAVLITNFVSVLLANNFKVQYETVKGLHDWVLINNVIRGFK